MQEEYQVSNLQHVKVLLKRLKKVYKMMNDINHT